MSDIEDAFDAFLSNQVPGTQSLSDKEYTALLETMVSIANDPRAYLAAHGQ